jgi:hypothetical protein
MWNYMAIQGICVFTVVRTVLLKAEYLKNERKSPASITTHAQGAEKYHLFYRLP